MTNLNGMVIISPLKVSRQWAIPDDELLTIKLGDKERLTEDYVKKMRELRQIEINLKQVDFDITKLTTKKTLAIIKEKHKMRGIE